MLSELLKFYVGLSGSFERIKVKEATSLTGDLDAFNIITLVNGYKIKLEGPIPGGQGLNLGNYTGSYGKNGFSGGVLLGGMFKVKCFNCHHELFLGFSSTKAKGVHEATDFANLLANTNALFNKKWSYPEQLAKKRWEAEVRHYLCFNDRTVSPLLGFVLNLSRFEASTSYGDTNLTGATLNKWKFGAGPYFGIGYKLNPHMGVQLYGSVVYHGKISRAYNGTLYTDAAGRELQTKATTSQKLTQIKTGINFIYAF